MNIVDYKLIGRRIQQRRKELNITQEALSEKIGVTVGYVSQIERGITKVNLDMLAKIADILNCDISNFVSRIVTSSEAYLNDELYNKLKMMSTAEKQLLSYIADGIISHRNI